MKKIDNIEQELDALNMLESLKNQGFCAIIDLKVKDKTEIENMKREIIVKNYAIRMWESERNGEKVFRAYVPCEFKEKNRKLIEAKTLDLLHEKIVADYYASQDNTYLFSQYFTKWLMEYKKNFVKKNSLQNLSYAYDNYIAGTEIDKKRIQNITRQEIISFLNELPNQHNVSLVVMQRLRTIFSDLFQWAYDTGVINSNIAVNISLDNPDISRPTPKKISDEIYTADELKKLVDTAQTMHEKRKNFLYLAIMLDTQLGLRGAELLALKKSDIDIENSEIIIQRTLRTYVDLSVENGKVIRGKYTCVVSNNGDMKTDTSVRKLPLTDYATKVLKEIFALHETFEFDSPYLFPNPVTKTTYDSKALNRILKNVCKKAAIPYRPSHKIRKTVLSNLFNSDALTPTDVQHWAGHASLNTTLKTYIRVEQTVSLRNKASNILSGVMG